MILLADSEGPDKTAGMRMVIWVLPDDTFLHGAAQEYRIYLTFSMLGNISAEDNLKYF